MNTILSFLDLTYPAVVHFLSGLLLSLPLYMIYARYKGRSKKDLEARRLQELNDQKNKFFTNITHELRTPLTIISTLADETLEHPEEWFQKGPILIKRSSRQLLSLVNQLQELSKLEAGDQVSVSLLQDDIVAYCKYLMETLQEYAEINGVELQLSLEIEHLQMDFDPEKIQSIFLNLVGNAIKFTPIGGQIYVRISGSPQTTSTPGCPEQEYTFKSSGDQYPLAGGFWQLQVEDTGPGIPDKKLPYIFNRFYQVGDLPGNNRSGTGIGLALTKNLVNLLEGQITVNSEEGKGTTFTVCLPVSQRAQKSSAIDQIGDPHPWLDPKILPDSHTESSNGGANLPLVLLIEDNRYVLQYLNFCLKGQYQIKNALNGQQGITKAIELIPDIIICDVIMPEKDGFEVVATVKKDPRTSHIPIILLTAKEDIDSRLKGLERGAEVYLTKPFDRKELEIRLRKLIELRRQLQQRYASLELTAPPEQEENHQEDGFLLKLRQLIEDNFKNEDFGVNNLCEALFISRTQLHRKLKALTDKSTSQFIRTIRMQKARELLDKSEMNVSEIGYEVGYRNSSHFSQEFAKEFGEAPSTYRQLQ